jgi:hypothetical protein
MIPLLADLTDIHVAFSLIALCSGLAAVGLMFRGGIRPGITAIYFIAASATSITGFAFPAAHFHTAHLVGLLSLSALAIAIYAGLWTRLTGIWRSVYAGATTISVYFLVFATVARFLAKAPGPAANPFQARLPFMLAESILLLLFIGFSGLAARGLRTPGSGSRNN